MMPQSANGWRVAAIGCPLGWRDITAQQLDSNRNRRLQQ